MKSSKIHGSPTLPVWRALARNIGQALLAGGSGLGGRKANR